jgi:hypothetical protein
MRPLQLLTSLLIGLCLVGVAAAECGPAPENAREFVHEHTVDHFNGDPPSRETDTLALWESSVGERRFSLCAVGPNYHTCFVEGSLHMLPSGELLFVSGNCKLMLKQAGKRLVLTPSPGWQRVGEGGVCPKQFSCGMYGSVESGEFAPVP